MTYRIACLLLLLGAGCGTDVHFDDDFDPAFDIDLSDANELHLPYATGTDVTIDVHNAADEDRSGWTVTTSDPSVIAIDSVELVTSRRIGLTAAGEGTATLTLRDEDGDVLRTARLEVVTPDRAELFARGPLRHGLATIARSDSPQVYAGGTAVFEVRYFAGDRRVYGQEMLRASAAEPDAMAVETMETSWEAKAEWLAVEPLLEGTSTIALGAGDAELGAVEVTAVPSTAVAAVELHGREADPQRGDSLTLLATAWDADGRAVWGAPFEWTMDGETVSGDGDIFHYTYDPAAAREVVLTSNGASETQTIHAGAEVAVTSSASVGCSATGRNATAVPIAVAFALLLLGVRRRR